VQGLKVSVENSHEFDKDTDHLLKVGFAPKGKVGFGSASK
jgi:hypothetical protein